MATRQNTLLIKRSNVIDKIPPISGLTIGELALNTADAKLYTIFTSGTTGATEVREIGWDRIHRTGDTVTGDFNFFGDLQISGASLPNGYALSVTGDTNQSGDTTQLGSIFLTGTTNHIGGYLHFGNTFITGNTTQVGNYHITGDTTQVGNYHITGDTSQEGTYTHSGDTFITGNTSQEGIYYHSGDTFVTGNTTQIGDITQIGNFNITGNTDQIGNFTITGNTTQSGSTTQVGNYNVTGNTNQLGYNYIVSATTGCTLAVTGTTCLTGPLNITGSTFMSGNFCMNNMNSTGATGTNCLDTDLIPTGTTVVHQFQGESGVLAHLGDLASGEPNSRGYLYFENNATLTSFVAVGVGNFTPIIGAPQTIGAYNNLFIPTTGTTTATTNKLTYNYPPATGTSLTYLKYAISCNVQNANNQVLTFQIRKVSNGVTTFEPIGMTVNPNSNNSSAVNVTGVVGALNNDTFEAVVRNNTGANPANSVLITDFTFSLYT